MAVPVLTVAQPGDRCCARGRRDAQVGARPRRMPSSPQSTLATPHPAPHSRPGCGLRFGECSPLAAGPRSGDPLFVTGRSARQAGRGASCRPGRDPGKRALVRLPAAGQPRSLGELVLPAPTPRPVLPEIPGVFSGFLRRPFFFLPPSVLLPRPPPIFVKWGLSEEYSAVSPLQCV